MECCVIRIVLICMKVRLDCIGDFITIMGEFQINCEVNRI